MNAIEDLDTLSTQILLLGQEWCDEYIQYENCGQCPAKMGYCMFSVFVKLLKEKQNLMLASDVNDNKGESIL